MTPSSFPKKKVILPKFCRWIFWLGIYAFSKTVKWELKMTVSVMSITSKHPCSVSMVVFWESTTSLGLLSEVHDFESKYSPHRLTNPGVTLINFENKTFSTIFYICFLSSICNILLVFQQIDFKIRKNVSHSEGLLKSTSGQTMNFIDFRLRRWFRKGIPSKMTLIQVN